MKSKKVIPPNKKIEVNIGGQWISAYKVKMLAAGIEVWYFGEDGYGGKREYHLFYPYHRVSCITYL